VAAISQTFVANALPFMACQAPWHSSSIAELPAVWSVSSQTAKLRSQVTSQTSSHGVTGMREGGSDGAIYGDTVSTARVADLEGLVVVG
jgi:hypothetical protein